MRKLLCFKSHVSLFPCIKATFYCLGVALQRCLAPTEVSCIICDLHEQPPGRHTKIFNLRDFPHGSGFPLRVVVTRMLINVERRCEGEEVVPGYVWKTAATGSVFQFHGEQVAPFQVRTNPQARRQPGPLLHEVHCYTLRPRSDRCGAAGSPQDAPPPLGTFASGELHPKSINIAVYTVCKVSLFLAVRIRRALI